MEPIPFAEQNVVYTPPEGVENCKDLNAYYDQNRGVIISAWKVTPEDLERINKTGIVWLWVWGNSQPPVALDTEHPFIYGETNG